MRVEEARVTTELHNPGKRAYGWRITWPSNSVL